MSVSSDKKLDDVDWHIGATDQKLPEEQRLAYARAHVQLFVYWLATRGMLTKSNTPPAATARDQEKLGTFIEDRLDDKIIFSMIASKHRDFVDAYYFGFYLKDLDNLVLGDREMYTFLPTTADCEAVAAQIDNRYAEYQEDPAGFTKQSKGHLRKLKLRRRLWFVVWLLAVLSVLAHFVFKLY